MDITQELNISSLDKYLIKNKESAYMLRVETDSMNEDGILRDDLIIVERGAKPKNGQLVLISINSTYKLDYFDKKGTQNVEAVVRSVIRKYK